jgi:predicted hotdog family 3-hydroxylacyl-ACP dehydratase
VRPIVTRFETFDGLNIITNVYTDGDQHFVAFEFTVSDQDEATRDTATARAAELEVRLGEWLFVIPGHKLEQLTHRLSDLLGQTG